MIKNALLSAVLLCVAFVPIAALGEAKPIAPVINNGSFESGFRNWMTRNKTGKEVVWMVSGECQSTAVVDSKTAKTGRASLHIVNNSPQGPHVWGSLVQPVRIEPDQHYKVSLWARAKDLASNGTVSIIVDRDWHLRPIRLPGGSYDWTQFSGIFVLPGTSMDFRILIEDRGELWIDNILLEPVPAPDPPMQRPSLSPLSFPSARE